LILGNYEYHYLHFKWFYAIITIYKSKNSLKIRGALNMEEFFKNYQFTFSAIGAVGSMGAVIISLWLAGWQNRSKIKATLSRGFATCSPQILITCLIVNKGILPVFIPNGFLALRLPFGGFENGFRQILDMSPEASKYPFKLESKKSETFIIEERDVLSKQLQEIKKEVGWLRFYFVRVELTLTDGAVFAVKGGNKLIRSLVKR
jgi:hypothetical protein